MINCPVILSCSVSGSALVAWLLASPALAAPAKTAIHFTPPLAAAKTIQVTEVVFEPKNGPNPGPMRQSGTMTFRIERPNRFRVVWKGNNPSESPSYTVSDGKTMAGYDGKKYYSQPTAQAEWPFPMMGLLNNMPGPVSAVPAVREGRKVLLTMQADRSGGRSEFWFDPKTHLLLRWLSFITWQGKTSEVMRTDYSGWVLNRPLPASVFRVPALGR